MVVIEWAKELNTILLEFEGQLRPSDVLLMTRKELFYLRKERREYHEKVKAQAERAAEEAKARQEREAQQRRAQANAQQYHQRSQKPTRPGTQRSRSSGHKPHRR